MLLCNFVFHVRPLHVSAYLSIRAHVDEFQERKTRSNAVSAALKANAANVRRERGKEQHVPPSSTSPPSPHQQPFSHSNKKDGVGRKREKARARAWKGDPFFLSRTLPSIASHASMNNEVREREERRREMW